MSRFFLSFTILSCLSLLSACSESSSEPPDAAKDASGSDDEAALLCRDRIDGYPCGAGKLCIAGTCVLSSCGDGFIDESTGEECDDQNRTDGDGCNSDCRFSCRLDEDCDDGNHCNGAERCIEAGFGKLCVGASAPLDCDGGAACTIYRCDPSAKTIEEACTSEPMDISNARCWRDDDGDGHPSFAIDDSCAEPEEPGCGNALPLEVNEETSCGCPLGYIAAIKDSTQEDCDDQDALIHPGAPELCGDEKDNNCDGIADHIAAQPDAILEYCGVDADNDGYPDPNELGEIELMMGYECVCPAGTKRIQESRIAAADCDPSNNQVHPGVTAYSGLPYCVGEGRLAESERIDGVGIVFSCSGGAEYSFDFNCDGEESHEYTTVSNSCGTNASCNRPGWTVELPECGQEMVYLECIKDGHSTCGTRRLPRIATCR